MAEFEIYKDQNNPGEFRWRLRANNNEIIADSGESYRDKDDCEHGIELVKTQSPSATVQDLTWRRATTVGAGSRSMAPALSILYSPN